MNREKEDQLPMMQVGFIDSICLPIYEVSTSAMGCMLVYDVWVQNAYHSVFAGYAEFISS